LLACLSCIVISGKDSANLFLLPHGRPECCFASALLLSCNAGVKQYTVGARFACLGVKFLEYSLAGITCGFIGQGVANSLMLLK
jgi:hypothetical protein